MTIEPCVETHGPAHTLSQNVIYYLFCQSAYVATCSQPVAVDTMDVSALALVKARLGCPQSQDSDNVHPK